MKPASTVERCSSPFSSSSPSSPSWLIHAAIIILFIAIGAHLPGKVQCSLSDNNFPPRFAASGGGGSGSEIVVRVKEGPSSLNKEIYRLVGEDPDGDALTFGVLGAIGEDILKIENEKPNQAVIYLRKELDRETRDSYSLVLTLTDGKLGKGNFVSTFCLYFMIFSFIPSLSLSSSPYTTNMM
jgi:hypothetical protein